MRREGKGGRVEKKKGSEGRKGGKEEGKRREERRGEVRGLEKKKIGKETKEWKERKRK